MEGLEPMSEVADRALDSRVVRYADLRPCHNAFVDSRTPGSERKENFTIIGPGVSENPEQFVHIPESHGFNIGAARQPAGCRNSQHSHETAEVFVVHTGRWRFDFGEHGTDASLEAGPGDVVSFPIHAFRGFTNIGKNDDEPGFLWAVLGGDDPGRVTWAPQVFDLAREYGLVLLENGNLVDTVKGEVVPDGVAPMTVTSRETVAALRRISPTDAQAMIARAPTVATSGETLVIGTGGLLPPTGSFTLSRLDLDIGESTTDRPERPEVLFVHEGALTVTVEGSVTVLQRGDTMTVPLGVSSRLTSKAKTTVFIVRRV
jgi:mannose-6-phosphate isomerase-like protein (cupin superfamily)